MAMTKNISDDNKPPVPRSRVNPTQTAGDTARKGKRRGAWSERAPRTGALRNISSMDRPLALPYAWSVAPIAPTTQSEK